MSRNIFGWWFRYRGKHRVSREKKYKVQEGGVRAVSPDHHNILPIIEVM
jgi:hypothetical protein